LAKLTGLIAQHHANILHIIHERTAKEIPLGFSKVILVLETRDPRHIGEVKKGLKREKYPFKTLS
jgi:threonine dehydratase